MDATSGVAPSICRVCKYDGADLHPLFVHDETDTISPSIGAMLMACASVKVEEDDELPHSICSNCKDELEKAFKFKLKCEDTDASMRKQAGDAQNAESNVKDEATNNILEQLTSVINDLSNAHANIDRLHDADANPSVRDVFVNSDYIQFLDNNQVLLMCRACSRCFTTLDGMKCHKRLHTGSLFKCKECGKHFTRQSHLQRHETLHARKKVHVCKICNKTLTRYEHLKRHLVTHLREKPYACATCNRGFNRTEHLAHHAARCKGEKTHICEICNKGFTRADSLDVHRKLHGDNVPSLPTLENLENIDEHYTEIDCNETNMSEAVPDSEGESSMDESSEHLLPEVNLSERLDGDIDLAEVNSVQEKDVEADAEHARVGFDADHSDEDDRPIIMLKTESKQETMDGVDDCDDTESVHSEYLPTKSNVVRVKKRKRGRPRKHPIKGKKSRKKIKVKESKVKVKLETDIKEEEGEYTCPICESIFHNLSLLERHALIHDGLKLHRCPHCSKEFMRMNHMKRHLLSHTEEKPFVCTICTKGFNRKDHLYQHRKLHDKEQRLECDICKKTFTRPVLLAKHKAAKHGDNASGEPHFECKYCLRNFTTAKYCEVHMKGHVGDKKFLCRICEKTFLSKSHLNEHMKFHNENAKKFLCSECGQRFIRNDYLVIHMRRHRGEKPFKCQYCGKGFPRTTDLTVHERYHTGEKTHLCTICGRGFGRAYNLTVHMRTHTGEKPYRCTYCDAAFAQGNDLKAHVRRHTGERFQCDFCSESFLMGYLLTQHKRNVHGLNVVSNIRRLQPVNKVEPASNPEDPPITIPLPPPVVPTSLVNAQFQAKWAVVQLQQDFAPEEDCD